MHSFIIWRMFPAFRHSLNARVCGALLALAGLLAGCAGDGDTWKIPFVYRIDVQQGNVIEQSMIDQLKPGMDKNQVRYIMGTPVLIDPFHSNRWEYFYSMQQAGGRREQRHITLYFDDNGKLSHIDGDVKISAAPRATDPLAAPAAEERTVVVPDERRGKGFFGRLWQAITPGGDEAEAEQAEKSRENAARTEATEDRRAQENVEVIEGGGAGY